MTTSSGGGTGFGTVFAMTPSGTILETFPFSGINGSAPVEGVIEGADGNLYGTTSTNGTGSNGKPAFGVIFTLNTGLH